jgi:arsenate reductase-like glutaredoxin family protein
MGCTKAQGFLEQNEVQVKTVADARKESKGRADAIALAREAARLIVARGKKTVTVDMKHDAPDDDTLAGLLLGPSGNLRAPTVRKGKTLYVGFNEDTYRQLLAGSP